MNSVNSNNHSDLKPLITEFKSILTKAKPPSFTLYEDRTRVGIKKMEKGFVYYFTKQYVPQQETIGVSSLVPQHWAHVLMIDYDDVSNMQVIYEDLKRLMEKWDFSDFYIFKTGDTNYHVLNFTLCDRGVVAKMLKTCRCDLAFKTMGLSSNRKAWTLRVTPKRSILSGDIEKDAPTYISRITGNANETVPVSNVHWTLYKNLFGIPKPVTGFLWGSDDTDAICEKYGTNSTKEQNLKATYGYD